MLMPKPPTTGRISEDPRYARAPGREMRFTPVITLRRSGVSPSDTLLLIVNLRGALRLDLQAHPETSAPDGSGWSLIFDSEGPAYGGRGDTRLVADGARPTLAMSGAGAVALCATAPADSSWAV